MAGALNAATTNAAPAPAVYTTNPNGGALSASNGNGQLPFAMPGVDPTMLSLMYGAAGPISPDAQQLTETSRALIGSPGDVAGALSSSKSNYDQAVQSKMTAINRAMGVLSNLDVGQSNLPLMAAAAGALQPTRTGSIGETIGNSLSAAVPQIEKQRAVQEEMANRIANLGISQGDVGMAGAQQDEGFLEKRLSLADQAAQQAGQIQARADLAAAQRGRNVAQYAGRVTAAEIKANTNVYSWVNNDPTNPNIGVWRDTRLPPDDPRAILSGPPQGAKPTQTTRWQLMHDAWLSVNHGDAAGALDYAAGHRTMPPEQMRAAAMRQAQQELGTGADPKDVDSRARDIYGTISGGFGGPTPVPPTTPSPGVTPTPPPLAHKMTPDDINQSLANARAAIQKNPQAKPVIIQRLKAAGIDTSGL